MRRLLTTMIALGALGAASAAYAQTVDASWDNCAPIVTDKSTGITAAPIPFYVSVLGQSIPHTGYEVWFLVGDVNRQLPDAWAFDAAGCNAGFAGTVLTYRSQPPAILSKTCPPFAPASALTLVKFQLSPPALGYATTIGNGYMAVSYQGGSTAINPALRYHMATFEHDFTFAVEGAGQPGLTCGGFETPMCITLIPTRVSWADTNEQQFLFTLGNYVLTFRGVSGCPGVPVQPSTWGQIKGQYRN